MWANVANAVLKEYDSEHVLAFNVYTEVIQDSVIALMKKGKAVCPLVAPSPYLVL